MPNDPLVPNIAEEFNPFANVQPDAVTSADAAQSFVPTFGVDPSLAPAQEFVPPFPVADQEPAAFNPFAAAQSVVDGQEQVAAPVAEDTLVQGVREDSIAYRDLGRQKTALVTQAGDLGAQIAAETDPKKRAALVKQQQELGESHALVSAEQSEAGTRADVGLAEAQESAQVAKADADLAQAQYIAEESQAARDTANAARLDLKAQQDDAMSRLNEDREKYRALTARGPKQVAVVNTFADITTEIFKATMQNRVADFSKVAERAWKRNRDAFADERDAARTGITLSGDRVRDIAVATDAAIAEEAAQKAAVFEQAAQRAQLSIQQAVTPLEKARAGMVFKGMQEQAEIAAAQAAQARLNALQKEDKRQLDNAHKRAQIGKELAATGKLTAETAATLAKARGRGRGGAGAARRAAGIYPKALQAAVANKSLTPKQAKEVFSKMVIDPNTGEATKREDGTFVIATSIATAKELNEAGAGMWQANRLVNEALALRGAAGWEPSGKFLGSEAGRRMESLSTQLLLANKETFGLGILSESDEKLLERIQGGSLSGMKDPRPVLKDMVRRMSDAYNTRRRTLAPGSQAIKFAQVSSAPKRTMANVRTALGQSPDFGSGDIVLPASRRLANVDELFDLHVQDKGGDIEAASKTFATEAGVLLKRAEDHEAKVLDKLSASRPANFGKLQREVAGALVTLIGSGDKSGEEINAAKAAHDKAKANLEAAASPEARALAAAYAEQNEYTSALRRKMEGELKKQAEQEKRAREQRERQGGEQFGGDF